MAKTLPQLKRQIAVLQRQADALKKKELKGVIARIKEAIDFYEITPADLGFEGPSRAIAGKGVSRKRAALPAKKAKSARSKTPSVIKYRDEAGHGWSGHGRRPQWFLDALASGKTAEDLLA